jgi:hypothetical protein
VQHRLSHDALEQSPQLLGVARDVVRPFRQVEPADTGIGRLVLARTKLHAQRLVLGEHMFQTDGEVGRL